LPDEIREKVRQIALQNRVSQQSLIRHMLFHYLSKPPWNEAPAPEPRTLRRTENEVGQL
jgi:hypothetical protein